MADLRNARESAEALETFDVAARVARESAEVLWQLPPSTLREARASVEVLLAPVTNVASWGFISIV